jgi:hypothetical protein
MGCCSSKNYSDRQIPSHNSGFSTEKEDEKERRERAMKINTSRGLFSFLC